MVGLTCNRRCAWMFFVVEDVSVGMRLTVVLGGWVGLCRASLDL